jgi:hypothetical protein
MKLQHKLGLGLVGALASCGPQSQPQEPVNNVTSPTLPAPSAPPAVTNSLPPETHSSQAPTAPAPPPAPAAPAARAEVPPHATSLPEPNGPIPPKSAEAAGQVIQQYGALIEEKRWAQAARLWGSSDTAEKFAAKLKSNRETHMAIGNLSEPEGAAGSIYITMPVSFYGKDSAGGSFRERRTVTLRRVNDVPGSTKAQRRWHIDRIEP